MLTSTTTNEMSLLSNVVIETSQEANTQDVMDAIHFIECRLSDRTCEDITYYVRNEEGSNDAGRSISVLPIPNNEHTLSEHLGLSGLPVQPLQPACLQALADASTFMFGKGREACHKSQAWNRVRREWNLPKCVRWDTACVMAVIRGGWDEISAERLLSGFTTVLIAPELVFGHVALSFVRLPLT